MTLNLVFVAVLLAKIPETIVLQFKQLNGIFAELVRKLCHTRVQEDISEVKFFQCSCSLL